MVKYAIIDESDESVREVRRFPGAIPKPPMKPGFRWVPVEDVAAPEYDRLREKLEVVETVMVTKLKRTPTKSLLSKASRKANADQEYRRILGDVVPDDVQLRKLTGAVRLLERRGRRVLTAQEQAGMDQLVAVGDWQEAMEAHLGAMLADIDAGNDPDIAAGWPAPPGA